MAVQLYEVGGSIRDEILGLENKDRDYVAVCDGGWGELLRWSNDVMDKVFLVTPNFFTIRGLVNNEVMDVVLARKDGAYSDGRHPDSVEPGTLEDDLARRDFTMNAIARSVNLDGWASLVGYYAEVIDPFGGRKDIEKGVIRCVGNSAERIEEDSLRILRALRFFVTKGLTLSEDLSKMLYRNRLVQDGVVQEPSYAGFKITDLLENVSRERVREELHKMLKYDSVITSQVLFGSMVHQDLQKEILGKDIWLKPTMEKR
jgi:tRNA nucleotidyltransferase (CCA-adding enzyme)